MDILSLSKSKTRRKIFELFLKNPGESFYLHEIKRELSLSAGNIRRELLSLVKIDLFERQKKDRLIYYKINPDSQIFTMIKISDDQNRDYCQTRDIFQARLDTITSHLQKVIGDDGYLLSAITGEIGNNSFDHNLGQWPGIPGVHFSHLAAKKTIILADRGQGILKTIRNILPETKTDQEALEIAFTRVISGRSPEKRGNGLKFVTQVIKAKKWSLKFDSGHASLIIDTSGKMKIKEKDEPNQGCLAVLKY